MKYGNSGNTDENAEERGNFNEAIFSTVVGVPCLPVVFEYGNEVIASLQKHGPWDNLGNIYACFIGSAFLLGFGMGIKGMGKLSEYQELVSKNTGGFWRRP